MERSGVKCFHCTHVFDLTNLKGEKRGEITPVIRINFRNKVGNVQHYYTNCKKHTLHSIKISENMS
jgi:hypothetical protein